MGPARRLLAKLAADWTPGARGTLGDEDVHGRLREVPVRKLYGIGPVPGERLRSLGVTAVGGRQDVPIEGLRNGVPAGVRRPLRVPLGAATRPCKPSMLF